MPRELGFELGDDLGSGDGLSGALVLGQGCVATQSEGCLNAPVLDGVAHGGFDEVGQCFARAQHSVEAGAQFGLDTDLGDDGVFHGCIAVRTHYALNSAALPLLGLVPLQGQGMRRRQETHRCK